LANCGRPGWHEEPEDELDSNKFLDPGRAKRPVSLGIIATDPPARLNSQNWGPGRVLLGVLFGGDSPGPDPMKHWLSLARQPSVVQRAIKVAAIVGTILVAINQGGALLAGELSPALLIKIPLTYLVPYCVSTYAAVGALQDPRR